MSDEQKNALRSIWRDLADKRIEHGVDWPSIVRTLFRDLDEAAERERAAAEKALRDAADDPELDAACDHHAYVALGGCCIDGWLRDRADRLASGGDL
jgi:hypothetical protein